MIPDRISEKATLINSDLTIFRTFSCCCFSPFEALIDEPISQMLDFSPTNALSKVTPVPQGQHLQDGCVVCVRAIWLKTFLYNPQIWTSSWREGSRLGVHRARGLNSQSHEM